METKLTGNEPAMPHGAWGQQTGTGLTIRQHFAAMAMQGIVSNPSHVGGYLSASVEAVKQADALIAELTK